MDGCGIKGLPAALKDPVPRCFVNQLPLGDKMDEYLLEQINHYRANAQSFGDAALDAMMRGDIGLARTASRQAAQYARIVQQLESGEKQIAPPEPEAQGETAFAKPNSISL